MFTKARKHLRLWSGLCVLIIVMLFAQSVSPAFAANETVTINMASASGAPTYRASGFIYGIAADGSQPPQNMLTDIKVRHMRAGGSQLNCPNGGFVNGDYTTRWNVAHAYWSKAHAIGARYQMILAGLWGSDGACNVPRWPGDNGDWTEYNTFVNRLIDDVIANGMTGSDLIWDMWNEPNIFFWGRTEAQEFEMWKRGVQLIRSRLPNAVIGGNSCACVPGGYADDYFQRWLDYIKANNVVPNIMSWHDLPNDPVANVTAANAELAARGITTVQGYSINEYGSSGDEQQPGPTGWYIGRLERANADGLRANWGGGGGLYQTMGGQVTSSWQPLGAWWMYKRYADQTGLRTNLTPSASVDGVVFQDSAAIKSITVLGKKAGGGTGNVAVVYNNIPTWLQNAGAVTVLVERMPSGSTYVAAPTVVSNSSMAVSGNSLTVNINWSNALDGYTITLTRGGGGGPTSTPPGPTATPGAFPVAGTYYRMINRNSGKVAEVSNFSTADGGNVQQWTSTGTSSQQWSFVSVGSGYYNAINRNSGKCLDVNGVSTADGANIQQWTCGSGTNQRWSLTDLGGGYYRLTAQHSGKVMEVSNFSTADGGNIQQWSSTGNNSQQWQIIP